MLHRPRRLGALTLTTVLTVTSVAAATLLAGAPAQAASSPSADQAQTWLSGELEGGLLYNLGQADVGLSMDAALLAAETGDLATGTAIRDAVAPLLDDYAFGGTYDVGATYGNQTAKVLAMVVATGGRPRAFGGRDVQGRLEAVTSPSGRITSVGEFADADSVIGQAFAVQGLTGAGSTTAGAARDYLAGLQCPDGSFALVMPTDGQAPPCRVGDASTDATAFALSALADAPGTPQAVLSAAVAWLATAEQADGSYGSDSFLQAPNSNSTGLAAAALGDACALPAAYRAAGWVRSVQLDSGEEAGAVAYDPAAFRDAQAEGIPDFLRDQFRRATAQAGLGLVWDAAATTLLSLSAGDGVVVVDGAAKGQTVCLTTPTGTTRLTGTGARLTVPATAPAAGTATYTATAGPGLATLSLGAGQPPTTTPTTPPPVTTPPSTRKPSARFGGKRLVVGERHRVRVSGLRAEEKVLVELRGRTVATGRVAALSGKLTLRFRVATRTGPARLTVTALDSGTRLRQVVRVVR